MNLVEPIMEYQQNGHTEQRKSSLLLPTPIIAFCLEAPSFPNPSDNRAFFHPELRRMGAIEDGPERWTENVCTHINLNMA